MTTPTALQTYATAKLKADVARLLKDPIGVASARELRVYWIPMLRKVAVQCGVNFNKLLCEGSPFEQERIKRIEAGQPYDAKSIGALSNERNT